MDAPKMTEQVIDMMSENGSSESDDDMYDIPEFLRNRRNL